jgi:hypothetical protein
MLNTSKLPFKSHTDMKQDVADFVKVAARKLTGAGAIVEDTSVPLHTDGTV